MMVERKLFLGLALLLVVTLLCIPASAVLQELRYFGPVTKLDPATNELNMKTQFEYRGGTWKVRTSQPILTGTVPDAAVFTYLKKSDWVEVTSLGAPGGTWSAIGKVENENSVEKELRLVFGDPALLPSTLWSGYALTYVNTPDCAACSGTTCIAPSSTVTLKKNGVIVMTRVFSQGESYTYVAPGNEQWNAVITYIEGEASSAECPWTKPDLIGPQPVSNFLIRIVQKMVPTATPSPVATATPAVTATETMAPTATATPAATPTPGFAAAAALTGMALALVAFRKP